MEYCLPKWGICGLMGAVPNLKIVEKKRKIGIILLSGFKALNGGNIKRNNE